MGGIRHRSASMGKARETRPAGGSQVMFPIIWTLYQAHHLRTAPPAGSPVMTRRSGLAERPQSRESRAASVRVRLGRMFAARLAPDRQRVAANAATGASLTSKILPSAHRLIEVSRLAAINW